MSLEKKSFDGDRFNKQKSRYDLLLELSELSQDNRRLLKWVSDLQSGMWVNCVYCGHRYGPGETTPVSMADALKAHIEVCPEHPASKLKTENDRLRGLLKEWLEVSERPVSNWLEIEERTREALK